MTGQGQARLIEALLRTKGGIYNLDFYGTEREQLT